MTVFDLRCDRCGVELVGPARSADETGPRHGVGFVYHPGDPALSDNSSMACSGCWAKITAWLGTPASNPRCSVCDVPVTRSLFINSGSIEWQLCGRDAVDFLNSLRTVQPKLDRDTFVLPSPPTEVRE